MKLIKITLFSLLVAMTTSCNQVQLPNDLIQDNTGYEKLTDYIYSHFPDLKDNMEVMEFSYSGSIHPQRDELSSSITMNIVRGDNKDFIIAYGVDSEGKLTTNNVDISVGDIVNQTLSNSYETYKPFLFSAKEINLDTLREIVTKATEEFKKEANATTAYCSSIVIEKKENKTPEISVTIKERKFNTNLSRYSTWSMEGKRID